MITESGCTRLSKCPRVSSLRLDYAAIWPYRRRPNDVQANRFTDPLRIIILRLLRFLRLHW